MAQLVRVDDGKQETYVWGLNEVAEGIDLALGEQGTIHARKGRLRSFKRSSPMREKLHEYGQRAIGLRQGRKTYVSHQLFLSATGYSDPTGTLALAQNAATLLPSRAIGMNRFATQDRASDGGVLDLHVGMAQSLPLVIQQDVNALDGLLKPGLDLARSNVLS